jgi:hypothetical protein
MVLCYLRNPQWSQSFNPNSDHVMLPVAWTNAIVYIGGETIQCLNFKKNIYLYCVCCPLVISILYPPTPAFAKAGAAPGTTAGVEPVLKSPQQSQKKSPDLGILSASGCLPCTQPEEQLGTNQGVEKLNSRAFWQVSIA